jgi:soluble lytic murein transglycosylase-like protein
MIRGGAISCALCGIVAARMALFACDTQAAASEGVAATSGSHVPGPPAVSEQLSRAMAYEHGEGVPKDQKLAAALYCEAAVQGSSEAAFQLGWMYANGRGVPRDDGAAGALFQLAASEGHDFAKTALEHLGNTQGMLPDCMAPIAPPNVGESFFVAQDDHGRDLDPFASLPADKMRIVDAVQNLAPRYGIDPRLALSVIAVESNFNGLARSVKNAQGLMQLIPETAARFNVRNPFDMLDNIRGGLAYLRWLLAYYRGEVALAAAAYNAGERTVDKYRGVPPFPETQTYVRKVLALFHRPQHPYDPAIVQPSTATAGRASRAN